MRSFFNTCIFTLLIIFCGCFNMSGQTLLTFTVSQPPPLQADAGKDTIVKQNHPIQIGGSPAANGGTSTYTYLWTPATGLNNATIANPTATLHDSTTFNLKVTDSRGCTSYDDITIRVDTNTTGIDYPNRQISMSLYPNPVSRNENLVINLTVNPGIFHLSISNTIGARFYEETFHNLSDFFSREIGLNKMNPGVYYISVSSDNALLVKKVIIF
jgi:hypothetical protein